MKCYINMIGKDYVGVTNLQNGTNVFCKECGIRVGRISQVHGRPAVVVNHGGIKKVTT